MTFSKRRTEEDDLQIQVARYLDLTGWRWFHYPSGGKRNKAVAWKLKKMGAKSGVPDIMIFEPWADYQGMEERFVLLSEVPHGFGIAIELKVQKRKPSGEQKLWLAALKERGWLTAVCYSLDEVRDVVSVLRGAL